MRYGVITHASVHDLVKHVNAAIKEGWSPQGGIAVLGGGGQWVGNRYIQAMTHPNPNATAAGIE